tara:strand:+ start:2560 stop:3684 length:1125 start_codon:yes stop_codon:yes gene_type:complete
VADSIELQLNSLKLESNSYKKLGDFGKAEKYILKGLELRPEDNGFNHELAKIYFKREKYLDSLEILRELSKKVKRRQILFKDIAMCYYKMNELEKALEAVTVSLSEDSNNISSLYVEGLIYKEMGNFSDSMSSFRKLLKVDPDNRDTLYQLGKIYHQKGKYREALESFDKVLEFRPRDNEVLKAKGLSHDELEEYKDASEALKKSINVDDEIVFNDRGVALSRLGYNHKAIDSYRRALASNPKYSICWFNLGKALFRVGDLKAALTAFQTSTELNPNNRSAWNNRGVTLRQLNRLEESLDCYERALALKEEYAWAWHNKGYALELLDRPREALESYVIALEHKPDSSEHGGAEWEKLKKDTEVAIARLKKLIGE